MSASAFRKTGVAHSRRCGRCCRRPRTLYRELNRRANRVAHEIRALGGGQDSLIGLCVERSLEMVVGILGVLKAGGAYVPLDPVYPKDRLAFMMTDARITVILTQKELAAKLPAMMRGFCVSMH